MKKLALVLGGGAAKGFAHIGVLQILEENGIKPDLIVGTSIGAIVGGVYASGLELDNIVKMSTEFSMKKISDISLISMLRRGTMMRGQKIESYVHNLLGDLDHKDLKIPFTAVATELSTGKQYNLNSGLLWKNVLASSAMPAVFPSVDLDGKVLCDGGIKDNIPVDVARKQMPNSIILAVDVIGDYARQVESGGLKLMTQILNMSTLYMTQLVDTSKADLVIKITQPNVKQMDFTSKSATVAIDNGRKIMKRNLNKLLSLLNS